MGLDKDQKHWVTLLTGVVSGDGDKKPSLEDQLRAARAREEIDEQALRDVYLEKLANKLDAEKAKMSKAFQMQLELEGKPISTKDKRGDQTKEFDKEETSQLTKGPTGKEMDSANRAFGFIDEQRALLEGVQTKRSKIKGDAIVQEDEPLFTEAEISDELYEPLVRELIMPENFVPKRFSKTQKMLDATNDLYLQEIEGFTDKSQLDKYLSAGSKLLGLASKVVDSAVLDVVGSQDPSFVKEQAVTMGMAIKDLSVAAVSLCLDGAAAVVKQDGAGGASTLVNGVSSILSSALSTFTGNKDLATAISSGLKVGADAGVMMTYLTKKPEPNWEGAMTTLGDAVSSSFTKASTDVDSKNTEARLILTTIGSSFATLFTEFGKAAQTDCIQMVKDGKWAELTKAVSDIAQKAVLQATSSYRGFESLTQDKVGQGKIKDQGKSQDDLTGQAGETIKALADLGDTFKEKAKATDKKAKEKQTKEVEEQLKAEQEDYQKSLDQLGKPDPNTDELKSIGRLIDQLKRDQAIMATVSAVAGLGVAVAEQFFAPMAAAGNLQAFITNLAAATQRAIDMRNWIESRTEADSAVSPYKTSIDNFVKNQREQFAQHTIKAALSLIQLGANIAGTVTPFGKVAAAGAKLVDSMEDLAYKFYKEQAVKSAWNTTKQALDNPENRKLGLIARDQNPTLAKYCLAYGAIIVHDAIALSALNKCGLDRETLASKDANVGQVKKYLELYFSEDNVVKGEYQSADWERELPPPGLTVKCWMQTWAVCKENLELSAGSPPEIIRGLKEVDKLVAVGTDKLKEGEFDLYLENLAILSSAFAACAPAAKNSDGTAKVSTIAGKFGDLADITMAQIREVRDLRFAAVM